MSAQALIVHINERLRNAVCMLALAQAVGPASSKPTSPAVKRAEEILNEIIAETDQAPASQG